MNPPPEPVLLLHVGAMKTGTTYVQHLLQDNRRALEDAGWWVPEHKRVVQATRELLELEGVALGSGGGGGATLDGAPRWTALLDEARARTAEPGRRGAVLSMEFLSFMVPRGAALVRESATGLDLQVVLTVRDAVQALPSQWQSLTRNGQDVSWPDFVVGARSPRQRPPLPGARAFRRTQDVPRMLRTWGDVVPPERLAVVTVPRGPAASRDLLWTRLCGLLGVDPATTDATAFDNPQLGYGSCELMRLVNGAGLGDGGAPRPYRRVVRRLTRDHLLPLREQQTRPRVDEATAAFAVGLNARTLALVAERATLVGDPADLPVTVGAGHDLDAGDLPVAPPAVEVMRAAVALHDGALALCAEQGVDVPESLAAPLPDDVTAAVDRLAALLALPVSRPRDGRG
ncbi:hypothetical protein [Nocardioides sp.]|uniref:hypothetical protein n=1 Tax=Nocardioides sp. TaxID=35761 RepID=UPI002720FEE8|nr:hypothetical protein [Nocardioides sp.]MDO9457048.1 hypothetical protein [Nocardioides sp.]